MKGLIGGLKIASQCLEAMQFIFIGLQNDEHHMEGATGMSDESLTELLRDMRMQVSCSDKAEMPIPLYLRIKEVLESANHKIINQGEK
jgi:hypothetical protein